MFYVCSTQRTKFLRLFALNFATKLKFIHFENRLECMSVPLCWFVWERTRARLTSYGIGKSPLPVAKSTNTHTDWLKCTDVSVRASEQVNGGSGCMRRCTRSTFTGKCHFIGEFGCLRPNITYTILYCM